MFLDNKYSRAYYMIVGAKYERQGYTERHHIIPRSIGGTDDPWNIVILTAREHFICHKLLPKMTTGLARHKMLEAFAVFSNNSNRTLQFNSRQIGEIRAANAEAASVRNKGNQNYKFRAPASDEYRDVKRQDSLKRKWVNNGEIESFTQDWEEMLSLGWVKGRMPFTEEHLNKITSAIVNREKSPEECRKISESKKGKKFSPDHVSAMKLAQSLMPTETCEFCGKTNKLHIHNKSHGEFCKKNPNRTHRDLPIYKCVKCSLESLSKANITRWHNENCKVV